MLDNAFIIFTVAFCIWAFTAACLNKILIISYSPPDVTVLLSLKPKNSL